MKEIMRSLEWDPKHKLLRVVDQRHIPTSLSTIQLTNDGMVKQAICNMSVRGAPAIGVAAAYGVVLAAWNNKETGFSQYKGILQQAIQNLRQSRPTAVNLMHVLDRMGDIVEKNATTIDQLKILLEDEAVRIDLENSADCLSISKFGAELIQDGDTIIHHCNTGALATVEWGTALGAISMAHRQGKRIRVLVDETRPRLQGARLTAWELQQYGIPFDIITDSSAGYFLKTGKVNKVMFGADRVARNGDVVNKIGTYMLALGANSNNIPVFSIFPLSSVDLTMANGEAIPIEERAESEVLDIQQHYEQVMPDGATALNPAFDITPHNLITAWVTEKGVIRPPFEQNITNIDFGPRS